MALQACLGHLLFLVIKGMSRAGKLTIEYGSLIKYHLVSMVVWHSI